MSVGNSLGGKVALVTGGGSGIGEACAQLLARAGARVAVADLNLDGAERVTAAIGGERAFAARVDVTDSAAVDAVVAETVERFGGLHIGVNNAGVGGTRLPTADQTDESWRAVVSVNLDGVFYSTRAEIRAMREAGSGGSIINIASILGAVAFPNAAGYVAAKHGVVGLTRAAALDHAADGIRVNAVGPGFITTPLLGNLEPEERDAITALHPVGRLGSAEDVAALVLWLAGDAAGFATGAYYPIDGGYLAR